MHGLIVGAIYGMGFIALTGGWRSVRNWRNSKKRPSRAVLIFQVALQVALGVTALVFATWFMLYGE